MFGFAALGPLQLSTKTFARVPFEEIASCRLVTPVANKLVPATEMFIGRATGPFSEPVLSAIRPDEHALPFI